MTPQVETATAAHEAAVYDTLMLAFASDPMARWTWPDAHVYLEVFPRFAKAFGGAGFALGTAHRIGNEAAALWLPPGVEPDSEAMDRLMQGSLSAEVAADVVQIMEQMTSFHPQEEHWYLPMIGADPAHQGKGLGSALLKHALAICDRDGVAAYLESSNPRNIPLYERHGFVRLGSIQAGSSPVVTPMLRKAKRR